MLFMVFLTVFLALAFTNTVAANFKVHFPPDKTVGIRDGMKVHFGDTWVYPQGTSMTITVWFISDWLNYTVTAGTQQIHNGTKPSHVYFDNVLQIEDDTWSYSGGTVTVSTSSTAVGILWGGGDTPPTYGSISSSSTVNGTACLLSSYWNDDVGLSYYALEHNNTGSTTWMNGSFGGTPSWVKKTITLNTTVGVVVAWRTHGNDTADQWNQLPWQYITVTTTSQAGEIPSSWVPFLDFIWAGDFLGFIQGVYVNAFQSADLFFGVLILLFMVPLYIRTRSLLFMSILWILLGSLFLVAVPIISGLAILLLSLGLAGMFFRLFMRVRS